MYSFAARSRPWPWLWLATLLLAGFIGSLLLFKSVPASTPRRPAAAAVR